MITAIVSVISAIRGFEEDETRQIGDKVLGELLDKENNDRLLSTRATKQGKLYTFR